MQHKQTKLWLFVLLLYFFVGTVCLQSTYLVTGDGTKSVGCFAIALFSAKGQKIKSKQVVAIDLKLTTLCEKVYSANKQAPKLLTTVHFQTILPVRSRKQEIVATTAMSDCDIVCVVCVRWLGSHAVIAPRLQLRLPWFLPHNTLAQTVAQILAQNDAQFVNLDYTLLKICLANGAELSRVLSKPPQLHLGAFAAHAAFKEAWRKLISSKEANTVTDIFVTLHSDVDVAIDRVSRKLLHEKTAHYRKTYAKFLNNPRFALAIACQYEYECIDERLKMNKRFVLKAVSVSPLILAQVDDKFKNDYDVVLAAVARNGDSIWLASAEMRRNKTIVLTSMLTCKTVPDSTMPEMCSDKDVMLAAVKKDGLKLRFASLALQTDVELVIAAVQQTIDAMMHVHPDMFDNQEVQRSIIECWGPTEFSRNAQKYDWQQTDRDESCD